MFEFGAEGNIPTWYSSSALLLCSVLLAIIATAKKSGGDRYALHWRALSVVFLFLSVDEAAGLHEKVGWAMRLLFDFYPGGFLRYAWVIPYSALLLVLILVMWKFFVDLPSKTRRLFFIAGFIFLTGALGLEMVAARYVGFDSEPIANAIGSSEELLEMLGVIVFIYALMSYISTHLKHMHAYIDGK